MAITLPPPPKRDVILDWKKWVDLAWRRIVGEASTSGDANATIPANSTYHGVTALTAGRVLSLPESKGLRDGDEVVVQDESGAAGTYTITISPQGLDTVNGGSSVTISSNYGRRRIIKRGAGKFFSA